MIGKSGYGLAKIAFLLTLAGLSSCVTPETETAVDPNVIIVDQAGRGRFLTIQEAVRAANMGQVIKIRGGTYAESVSVATGSLTLEAFDPVNEPVVLDGADQALLNEPPAWEPAGAGVFAAGYRWPFDPPTDAEYSDPESGKFVFQAYEDETLLRGYRNPFDRRFLKNKTILRFPFGRFGLAGAYASTAELTDGTGPGGEQPAPDVKPLTRAGRCYFDRANGRLVVAPVSGEPGARRYAVPVLPHLLSIGADKVKVRNLVFTHALDYAVSVEGADGAVVEGCLFRSCHFAVRARKAPALTVRDNVVIEIGFWERYSGEDAAGTLYERSAIAVEPDESIEKIVIENNVVRGTPFSLRPGRGTTVIAGNAVSHSVFGLFAPRSLDAAGGTGLPGRLEVDGNLWHHLDGGIAFPSRADPRLELYVYRNCFYLADKAGQALVAGPGPARSWLFCNNVLAFAGPVLQRPLDGWLGESPGAFNNLFYAANIEYTIFAATGTGDPYPVIGGSLLGDNLFITPRAEAAGVGTYVLRGAPCLFARIRGSAAAVPAGAEKKSRCFALGRPLEDKTFFNDQFDPLVPLAYAAVYRDGAAAFSRAFRERLFDAFRLDEKSPARGIGRPLEAGLPGADATPGRKPDVGAREF